jgi:hypothetical protein
VSIEHTNRYILTPDGIKVAVFYIARGYRRRLGPTAYRAIATPNDTHIPGRTASPREQISGRDPPNSLVWVSQDHEERAISMSAAVNPEGG